MSPGIFYINFDWRPPTSTLFSGIASLAFKEHVWPIRLLGKVMNKYIYLVIVGVLLFYLAPLLAAESGSSSNKELPQIILFYQLDKPRSYLRQATTNDSMDFITRNTIQSMEEQKNREKEKDSQLWGQLLTEILNVVFSSQWESKNTPNNRVQTTTHKLAQCDGLGSLQTLVSPRVGRAWPVTFDKRK